MSALVLLGPGSQAPVWITALEKTCFGTPWGTVEDGEYLWTAPAGFARWRVVPGIGEAELLRIAVQPAARRTGLGRTLLAETMVLLEAMGVTEFRLEVRVANRPARALYESQGWVFQGLRKGYYPDGEDAALYLRTLDH